MPHVHHHHSAAGIHHDHHGGSSASDSNRRRLMIALSWVLVYVIAEFLGGLFTGSLALLADAGHMLSDAASLGLSLFALWIAQKPATSSHTYGYYRAEILAALINAVTLGVISIFIFYEAYERIGTTCEVDGGWMLVVAAGGLVVNLIGLWVLGHGREESLNMQGAWLHVLADALGSIAAIAAAGLIWGFDWHWADPLASVLIGMLVLYSAWALLRRTVAVLMESTPKHLDVDRIREAMRAVEHVRGVHDLHVWTITSGFDSLSAHVTIDSLSAYADTLIALREMLDQHFGIQHVTLQLEPLGLPEQPTHV